jgi:hypothetical protein
LLCTSACGLASLSVASTLDQETSLSVTYAADWTDCDGTIDWERAKFTAVAAADQIALPPPFQSQEAKWGFGVKEENNSLHIMVWEETNPMTPEDAEPPVVTIFGPNAIIKLRKETLDTSSII